MNRTLALVLSAALSACASESDVECDGELELARIEAEAAIVDDIGQDARCRDNACLCVRSREVCEMATTCGWDSGMCIPAY